MPPVERPILMNPASMRGLMDNRKHQTRRLLKPQPSNDFALNPDHPDLGPFKLRDGTVTGWGFCDADGREYRSPYGGPGDLLWTRETWRPLCRRANPAHRSVLVQYRAGGQLWMPCLDPAFQVPPWWKACLDPWRPSVFLPRWASRALLEVVDVRPERVQQTSFADCLAEGIYRGSNGRYADYPSGQTVPGWQDPRESYRTMWDSINQARGQGWAANPWVWVIAFKVLELHGGPRPDFCLEETLPAETVAA